MINNELYVTLQEHDEKGRFQSSKIQVKNKVLLSNNADFYIFIPDSQEFVLESPEFYSLEELDAKIAENFAKDENGQFRCSFCTFVQSKRSAIKAHVERHIQTIRFPCQQCDFKTRTRALLRSHRFHVHRNSNHESKSEIQEPKSDIVLKSPQSQFSSIEELDAKHESQLVIQEPKSEIVLESSEFDSIEELDAKILQEYIVKDESGKWRCSFCNFVRARCYVKAHVERHIQTIWFPCQECDFKTRTRNSLKSHRYHVHWQ